MTKTILRVGDVTEIFNTKFSIINRQEESGKYGKAWLYICKLRKDKNWGLFEYTDSIQNYMNCKSPKVDDIMYCLISDYQIVEESGKNLDDIEIYLVDCFGYNDIREIKRIAKALLRNYELVERVFTSEEIEKLVEKYREY